MNETIVKFGYPGTCIREWDHWVLLLRQAQPTLGSCILAAKSDATAFGEIDAAAFTELSAVTRQIESALLSATAYSKINYLMLMMVDPHVHFHIIPRYDGVREWHGMSFADTGWPKTPDLAAAVALSSEHIMEMADWLKSMLPSAAE
jgi:diadenosine tetraphosphate (Ap4A) HIT family hydrolase